MRKSHEHLRLLLLYPAGFSEAQLDDLRRHLPGVELVKMDAGREGAVEPAIPDSDAVLIPTDVAFETAMAVVRDWHKRAPWLPLLVFAEVDNEARAMEALRAGAHDFVVLPQTDGPALARRIRYAVERRNLERSMHESQEFFRLVWDNLTDLVAIIDVHGERIYNSPSYRAVLGEPAELLGTDSFRDIHPDDRDRIRELFQQSLATGEGRRAEFRFLRGDGVVRHIESQATVIPPEPGKPPRLLVVGRDVTERKRAEQELREREEFFRLISENFSDLVAVLDRDGRRLYNSPSYGALFGNVNALRGSDSFAEIHPQDREMVRRVFEETVVTGRGQRIEYRFVLRGGEVRYMESVGNIIRDVHGRTDRVVVVSRDVTDRKRSEDAIRESEERYRRLLGSTSDYNFSVTVRDGRSVATTHSPGCLPVTGYTPAEFREDPQLWYNIIAPADRRFVLDQVERILQGQTPPPFEHRILRKDGHQRWIRHTVVPRRNSEGKLITYDGLITDVTERRRAERLLEVQYGATGALAESGTLADALSRILCAVCLDLEWDAGIYWNLDEAAALLRCAASWAAGDAALEAFEACCQRSTIRQADGLVGDAWRQLRAIWMLPAAPGLTSERALLAGPAGLRTAFAVPVTYGGEAVGVLEFLCRRELTREEDLIETLGAVASQIGQFVQRKRLDQAARESQERLELVILGSNDGVWDWDVRTNAVYFSPRWKGMLGYADHEIANRFEAWAELTHPEDRDRALRTVRDYFEGRSNVYELEHRLRHKDGSYRWILARGVALRDGNGRPIRMAGSHVDLTERKRAAEQLQAANAELARSEEELRHKVSDLHAANAALRDTQLQLIQAAKMEVVGTLAAGVAHEVRNPLQTLLMGLEYLTSRPDADPTNQGVLADMRHAVQRADGIVKGLLEFSALNHPERSHHDLNELLRQALHLAAFALNRGQVKVELDLAPGAEQVCVEANKIEQALINLVVNAVHAMPEGGTLTIRSRWVTIPAAGGNPARAEALVTLEDTGTGIPAHLLGRVFDPFFTTKPQGVGSGLGLSVTKRIIELHGGDITLENRPEGGVRVTIRLPCGPA